MNGSLKKMQQIAKVGLLSATALWAGATVGAEGQTPTELAQQIWDTMIQLPGSNPAYRAEHAKGIVCAGTFTPSGAAATLSKAAHFQGGAVPVIVRFSNGSQDPAVADNSGDAGPRGMSIRFSLPDNHVTDIETLSHNGFVVSTGEDFLALLKSIVATDPSKPHPWPVETFLGAHPLAAKFAQESQAIPASFGTVSYFSNDSFVFVNKQGVRQVGRYQFVPFAGEKILSEADAKARSPNFLAEEVKTRLAGGPIRFHMIVQVPNPGDRTNDPSLVWPHDRKTIEVGVVSITSVVADSATAEKALVFFPTDLTEGIELSDDPFPALRASVYARSFARRQANAAR